MQPQQVKIVEVGPRDGLQNEPRTVPLDARVELIRLLGDAGMQSIEVGSFVSERRVPQLSGSGEVLKLLRHSHHDSPSYSVLVPNIRGLEEALAAGATQIAVFTAASDAFSQQNIGCSIAQSMVRIKEVVSRALSEGLQVRGYISCVLGCPYQGAVPVSEVAHLATLLYELGCYEIALGDTIGIGTPSNAQAMIEQVANHIPLPKLAVHFHDTYGQALANIYAVLQLGVQVLDSSIAGLGGCPYAPGASGNVATEDVVYMLDGLGIHSGINMQKLALAASYICAQLACTNHSKAALALSKQTAIT